MLRYSDSFARLLYGPASTNTSDGIRSDWYFVLN
jgi:hypothetical protein